MNNFYTLLLRRIRGGSGSAQQIPISSHPPSTHIPCVAMATFAGDWNFVFLLGLFRFARTRAIHASFETKLVSTLFCIIIITVSSYCVVSVEYPPRLMRHLGHNPWLTNLSVVRPQLVSRYFLKRSRSAASHPAPRLESEHTL